MDKDSTLRGLCGSVAGCVALWQWLMCKVETKEGKSWQGKDRDRATRENLSDEKRHGFRRPLILDVFDIPM